MLICTFNNRHEVLLRVSFDLEINQKPACPGQQMYEKMIAWIYSSEILRLLLGRLHESVGLLQAGPTSVNK